MKKAKLSPTVPANKLRWKCDPSVLKIKDTNEIEVCQDIIGQNKGVNALRMGFDIKSRGYNIFVNGLSGTGRKTAIKCLLSKTKRITQIPDDKLYVNNFKNPDMPRLIRLPAGKGRGFKTDMNDFIEYLETHIPGIFESKDYQDKKKKLIDGIKNQQKKIVKSFEEEIAQKNFALIQMQVGLVTRPAILPLIDKKAINFEQLSAMKNEGKLTAKEYENIEKVHAKLSEKMESIFKKMRDIEIKMKQSLKKLDNEMINPFIKDRIDEIKEKFNCKSMNEYLDEVQESIEDNLSIFLKIPGENQSPQQGKQPVNEDPFSDYRVNLLVDNDKADGAPVVFETSPSYSNLFGTVEVTLDKGGYSRTDFSKIKAGSMLKADGGFLIIEALDMLLEPGVWPALKRALKNGKLEIQIFAPVYMISISGMKPEPIEIDVKVAIIGDPYIYQLLYNQDQDFKKIFKLRADFDSSMNISEEGIRDYANFIKRVTSDESMLPLNPKAVGRIVEYGVRLAGRQDKMSTQFNLIADLLRESNYWAHLEKKRLITDKHVQKAIEEKVDRSRLIEEKIQEMIDNGNILIDTKGKAVGQINGLAVYDMGDYAFGKPSRITANVSVGSSGIINIEREAQMSGPIHNKGVLIISGYLRAKYAQNKPLAISASLCFEQSYSGVDGDSASSAEIYALLSALSGIPLRQDLAVTGSVNQKGFVQPIGGVNQKIEGFFQVCKNRGLSGSQGVLIPHQNVNDLMLKHEVAEAVKNKKFHIYPVVTIDQGIEILTGFKAGQQEKEFTYEKDTIHESVDRKLLEFADYWKAFKQSD